MNGRPSRITDIAATQKFDRPRAPWPTRQRIACRARSPSARHSRIGPAANRRALVTPRQARRRKATHWQRLRQAQRQRQPRRSRRRRIPYRRPLRWQPRRSPPIRPAQSRSIVPTVLSRTTPRTRICRTAILTTTTGRGATLRATGLLRPRGWRAPRPGAPNRPSRRTSSPGGRIRPAASPAVRQTSSPAGLHLGRRLRRGLCRRQICPRTTWVSPSSRSVTRLDRPFRRGAHEPTTSISVARQAVRTGSGLDATRRTRRSGRG